MARISAGDAFGELALTSEEDIVRKATVVTDEPSDCLTISKACPLHPQLSSRVPALRTSQVSALHPQESYRRILASNHEAHLKATKQFVSRLPAFKSMPDEAITKLCAVLQRRVFGLGNERGREFITALPLTMACACLCLLRDHDPT